MAKRRKLYTAKTGAKILGMTSSSLRWYARRFNIGQKLEGMTTGWIFTRNDLLLIQKRSRKWFKIEAKENRKELGLGSMFKHDPFLDKLT